MNNWATPITGGHRDVGFDTPLILWYDVDIKGRGEVHMKKALAFLLMISLLVSVLAFAAVEAEEAAEAAEAAVAAVEEGPDKFTSGDWEYTVLEDGTASISGYKGDDAEVFVPEELDGKKVSGIGDWALFGCKFLSCISIPDSVMSIGMNPFASCDKLTDIRVSPDHSYLVTIDGVLFSKPDKRLVCYPCVFTAGVYSIPQGIKNIGGAAFYECTSLTEITIPDSVTSMGVAAFYGCSSLSGVILPDNLTSIGVGAFASCSSLTNITISNRVTGIEMATFDSCKSLTRITIPGSVTSIGDHAFNACISLTDITIPDSVTHIGDYAFSSCTSLTGITIPDSVTSIGHGAFNHCISLTGITIPDSVISIGVYAFADCPSLTTTVGRNSYAKQYCTENEIQYIYADAYDWLND